MKSLKIDNKCILNHFSLEEESFCETCNQLEPYTMLWSDGGTWWCLDCAETFDNFKFNEDQIKELSKIELRAQIQYYETKLAHLKNQEWKLET